MNPKFVTRKCSIPSSKKVMHDRKIDQWTMDKWIFDPWKTYGKPMETLWKTHGKMTSKSQLCLCSDGEGPSSDVPLEPCPSATALRWRLPMPWCTGPGEWGPKVNGFGSGEFTSKKLLISLIWIISNQENQLDFTPQNPKIWTSIGKMLREDLPEI